MKLILAIDQGTTGSTVLLFDEQLTIHGKGYSKFVQHYPRAGWVEHDPEEIWQSVINAITAATLNVDTKQIAAIGITNQRETTLLWDKTSGMSACRGIVWQDRRTTAICETWKNSNFVSEITAKTGLPIDPYFSASKIKWLLDHHQELAILAAQNKLSFGTIDSFLLYRLTGQKVHATDATNASRTMLYDLFTRSWSPFLLDNLKIPQSILPEIRSSSEIYGHTLQVPGLSDGIPIASLVGDQQSALFGQLCTSKGQAKCTYGTGAFLLMNIGDQPQLSKHGLLCTVALQKNGITTYALEGSTFIAGALIDWLCDTLGLFETPQELDVAASSITDTEGVVLVSALAGLGALHWRPEARGILSGISRKTTKAHLARAALLGLAFQVDDLLTAMYEDTKIKLTDLKTDGGVTHSDVFLQIQSDVLNVPVIRPSVVESTALGAALLAGLAMNIWSNESAIKHIWHEKRRFHPQEKSIHVAKWKNEWKSAIAKA